MKIVIEIPDWAAERHLSIMAGMELLAYKPYGEDVVYVKEVRCNLCGWCCENPPKGAVPQGATGACIYLETLGEAKECCLGLARPWHCCWSDPILTKHGEVGNHCCVKYSTIPVED